MSQDDIRARRRQAEVAAVEAIKGHSQKGLARKLEELVDEVKQKLKNNAIEQSLHEGISKIIGNRNGVDGVGVYGADGIPLFRDVLVKHEDGDQEHQEALYEFFGRAGRTVLRTYWEIIADGESADPTMSQTVGLLHSARLHVFSPQKKQIRYLTIRDLYYQLPIYCMIISWDMRDYSNSNYTRESQMVVDLLREKLGLLE